MSFPPHFFKQSSLKGTEEKMRPPTTFFFGPPGTGKSYNAMKHAKEVGGSLLLVVPTIALKKKAQRLGLSAVTVQHVVYSDTLKYKVNSKTAGKKSKWKIPRIIIFGEIFQWSKASMQRCCALLDELPSDLHVIMEGDPYQHGAVCQNRNPSDEYALMQKKKKSHFCSWKRCYCKPVIESVRLQALLKSGTKTFLRDNFRLTNPHSLTIIDEILKIGNAKERRSQALEAVEHMIEKKFVPLKEVPDSSDIVRVTFAHNVIREYTIKHYERKNIADYDKETGLCIGCQATVTVTKRNKRGDYLYYNGMQVTVVECKKDVIVVSPDEDQFDDDEAYAVSLLEGGQEDLKLLKIPRELPGTKRTIIPNYIKTSYAVQGDTLNDKLVVVYLDGNIPLDALYVMTTRGNDTIFTSSNLGLFFKQLYKKKDGYNNDMLRKFWSLCN